MVAKLNSVSTTVSIILGSWEVWSPEALLPGEREKQLLDVSFSRRAHFGPCSWWCCGGGSFVCSSVDWWCPSWTSSWTGPCELCSDWRHCWCRQLGAPVTGAVGLCTSLLLCWLLLLLLVCCAVLEGSLGSTPYFKRTFKTSVELCWIATWREHLKKEERSG